MMKIRKSWIIIAVAALVIIFTAECIHKPAGSSQPVTKVSAIDTSCPEEFKDTDLVEADTVNWIINHSKLK